MHVSHIGRFLFISFSFIGLIIVNVVLLSGCASHRVQSHDTVTEPQVEKNEDPLEGVNRKIFAFNEFSDRWFLKPVTLGYKAVTPDVLERGLSNFFANLWEVNNIVNDVLQWKWRQAGNDSARLILNTVGGLGGLVDVATPAGFEKSGGEDFGQTLRVWGVKTGPYIVLPFLGPSSLTEALAIPLDYVAYPVFHMERDSDPRRVLQGLQILDLRAGLLGVEGLISGDRYIFIREAYQQNREFLVKDGEVVDDFGEDFDDFEDF